MKITYENKRSIIPRVLPKKSVISDSDLNEIKEKHNAFIDSFGWVEFKDTQHTEANRQNLTALESNKITINAGSTILTQKPTGGENLWDAVNNKIRPINLGDAYNVRIDFKATIASNDGYFDFALNIGGAIGNAVAELKVFPKGMGVIHNFSLDFPIYTLNTFVENGGELILNPSHAMTIFDKRIIIFKIGQGR
jgi:hypothetical protein